MNQDDNIAFCCKKLICKLLLTELVSDTLPLQCPAKNKKFVHQRFANCNMYCSALLSKDHLPWDTLSKHWHLYTKLA